ncbi:aminodeoxychorismate/anthranilate synthase component II [Taibaiella sp. KBW10]|uniref:anthranilate synthase component II n=1 Tax=Taibaiella sp. KBW10 TaxID=2153357 RepID=UPI000F59FA54|nr:aminodeoxychorismate/anthranilate synthase component II [Taibaiella sp. KBW10]RQO29820.1 aminodeoxychorismate/anthranilate synthase component II [Taibaiella sp. KBW10]
MNICIIDNYDSFTYNIVQLVRNISGIEPAVLRNDCFEMASLAVYDKLILSPGPGVPEEAGQLLETIHTYAASKSILGICLGHQAIGSVFGARLVNIPSVRHGIATTLHRCTDDPLFDGLPEPVSAGLYHSWVVDREGFPDTLEVTMQDAEGYIMALRHKHYDVSGVQFHPESILTPSGAQMITNWLKK